MSLIPSLTTQQVVDHLDKYVIGQEDAKRAIALVYRERLLKMAAGGKGPWKYITPANVLMVGPSGCGKSAVAQCLASLMRAPFIKIEITEFSQVGYVGREVKEILVDLVMEAERIAPKLWKEEQEADAANDELLNSLVTALFTYKDSGESFKPIKALLSGDTTSNIVATFRRNNRKMIKGVVVPIAPLLSVMLSLIGETPKVPSRGAVDWSTDAILQSVLGSVVNYNYKQPGPRPCHILLQALEGVVLTTPKTDNLKAILEKYFPVTFIKKIWGLGKNGGQSVNLKPLRSIEFKDLINLYKELAPFGVVELSTLLTIVDQTNRNERRSEVPDDYVVKLVEERGVVFVDEFDKIFVDTRSGNVGAVGVVRDLMPYMDGVIAEVPNNKNRRGGVFETQGKTYRINTANILWIASGAFQLADVRDIPAEILGRLPVHVVLKSLTADDLAKVLIKPYGSLTERLTTLLAAEGVSFKFTPESITAIAQLAFEANTIGEDTGARRLISIYSQLFNKILFEASLLPEDQRVITYHEDDVKALHQAILAKVTLRKSTKEKAAIVLQQLIKEGDKPS